MNVRSQKWHLLTCIMIDDVGFEEIWKETELQGECPGDAEKHQASLDNASGAK